MVACYRAGSAPRAAAIHPFMRRTIAGRPPPAGQIENEGLRDIMRPSIHQGCRSAAELRREVLLLTVVFCGATDVQRRRPALGVRTAAKKTTRPITITTVAKCCPAERSPIASSRRDSGENRTYDGGSTSSASGGVMPVTASRSDERRKSPPRIITELVSTSRRSPPRKPCFQSRAV